MFDGFRVAVDDPLLVRVLHGAADQHEQLQPIPNREPLAVAVLGDGHAVHQLHDEVGPARSRDTAIEDLGDVGVIHHRERLPLRLEPGDNLLRVHPRLDDLQGDLAADGQRLLGDVDDAHAPLADLLHQLVRADGRTWRLRFVVERDIRSERGLVEEAACLDVGGQESGHPAEQRVVPIAGLLQASVPLGRRDIRDQVDEDRLGVP